MDSSNRNGPCLRKRPHRDKVEEATVEEYPDQIGERLQQARERAGLTVDDVLFKTRIPRSVMLALEAGDFSTFSSPTYAKSFLSQYSEYLGVDAQLWLDALQPASFISGEFVQPLWKEADERKDEKVAEAPSQMGWLSGLSVLAASGALVFMAMKGYEVLEKKFGNESPPVVAAPVTPQQNAVVIVGSVPAVTTETTMASNPATQPIPKRIMEDLPEPPPRAIIVR